jgi:hypothetical protein
MTIFAKNHPEYARIESLVHDVRAEHALAVGEAIGNGLVTLGRTLHGWRSLFSARNRKDA